MSCVRLDLAAFLCLLLCACSSGHDERSSERANESPGESLGESLGASSGSSIPTRIVSLDFCADQYVLRFAERENILALSVDADKRFSYLREEAVGLPQVRPRTADVLALEPDLVVRSYGGGPGIGAFLEKSGVPVVQIGFPHNIAEVRSEVTRIGGALGQLQEARALVADMDRRLASLAAQNTHKSEALYMTPGGVTAGKGTLIHELMAEAGLTNFQNSAGWSDIPLERLAYESPDLVVAAFFESEAGELKNWSAARHPIAKAQLSERPVASVDGAWTACGGWFLIDAVEAMSKAAGSSQRQVRQ